MQNTLTQNFERSQFIGYMPNIWTNELYYSNGYAAVYERFFTKDTTDVIFKYPCNLNILQQAKGVIVHSDYSRKLANMVYGEDSSIDWFVIPLLRTPLSNNINRAAARKALNIKNEDFIICSFGMIAQTKLNHRLINVFLNSPIVNDDDNCKLIFVGKNDEGDYGKNILKTILESGIKDRITITGWTDAATFRNYLAAADIAVQLRTLSRGETSAAVLFRLYELWTCNYRKCQRFYG